MGKAIITDIESTKIEALLSQKLFTLQDVVNALDCKYTENQIRYHVTKKYPHLKGNFKKEYSKGGTKIEYLLKQLFPSHLVQPEVHIGERLRVDFVVGSPYNIGFEFDGVQHNKYSAHLHGSRSGFSASIERDSRKEFLLQKRGVTLVRISDLEISLPELQSLIGAVGYGTGVIDESFLTKQERLKLKQKALYLKRKEFEKRTKELTERSPQGQPELKRYKDPSGDSYKLSMKEKQKKFRKKQYEQTKEWRKKLKQKN